MSDPGARGPVKLGIPLVTAVTMVGCAAPPPPATCEQQVTAALERSITRSASHGLVVGLPRVDGVSFDPADPTQRWALVKLPTSFTSPATAIYAVRRDAPAVAAGGAASRCDLSQVYVVVQGGGIGAPVSAYGPLVRGPDGRGQGATDASSSSR